MESSLDLRDLEQFTDKKRWKTRQRDGINRYDSNNLSASEEVQSSLGRSMKYGTFGNSSFSVFGIDIDIQFDKDKNVVVIVEKVVEKKEMVFWNVIIENI